jgi:Sec-independent protein secretion pathway component TatC
MDEIEKTSATKDLRARISTLWIVVMFNMLFADVLTLFIPKSLQDILSGSTPINITPGLMLVMAVIIEIPIAMIFLSRVLKRRANRWANIVAGVITIAFVVGMGSLTPHYVFLAAAEVVSLLAIMWLAWKRLDLDTVRLNPRPAGTEG